MEGEIKIGGNYQPWVRHGDTLYLSGQIPRVGDTVMLPGRVGEDLGLAEAQEAAQICALRALALMRQALGSLDRIRQVLRITVCVQCTAEFTQHSEVADGASGVLQAVLGDAGRPTRTSVGVFQLPKNAAVEVDLIAAVVDV
ncbi:MAG: RidA family protein [Pseudomonadota bacterium]